MTELDDSERTPEEMLREVKVAYRVVEIYGPPDVDAIPYDAERTAAIDAEFDHWLAEVKREAVAEALLKNVTGRRKLADACLACGEPLERLDANTICRRCWFHGKDTTMQAEKAEKAALAAVIARTECNLPANTHLRDRQREVSAAVVAYLRGKK